MLQNDVLLFDDLYLHRTAPLPGMTKTRYAVAHMLFAPSAFSAEQRGLHL